MSFGRDHPRPADRRHRGHGQVLRQLGRRVIPPVGMNRTERNGAASALTMPTPPSGSAGKNFTTSTPSSRAAMISVAVATPGKTGTPRSRHRRTTAALKPGRDDEPGPGRDRPVDLVGGDHGAGADQQPAVGAHRPERRLGRRRSGT